MLFGAERCAPKDVGDLTPAPADKTLGKRVFADAQVRMSQQGGSSPARVATSKGNSGAETDRRKTTGERHPQAEERRGPAEVRGSLAAPRRSRPCKPRLGFCPSSVQSLEVICFCSLSRSSCDPLSQQPPETSAMPKSQCGF